MKNGAIRADWQRDDTDRSQILERVRLCVSLADPSLLPPLGQTEGNALPTNFQSLGGRGLTSLEGRMFLAIYGSQWFRLKMSPEIALDPNVPDEVKQQIARILFARELTILGILESAHLSHEFVDRGAFDGAVRTSAAFHSRKRAALRQIIGTGDCLEQLTDDYKLKVFRRDQYVTRRDSTGDVLYHIVRESIDPLSLPDELFAATKLSREELKEKSIGSRMQDIYTLVEWNQRSKAWTISQEVNGNIIVESEETISPFFSTPWKLTAGENYGRGFLEENLGDLLSFDNLCERLLDFAALASDHKVVKDYASDIRNSDLQGKSGRIIRGRVVGGQVQDIAYLKADKLSDFSVVHQTAERVRRDLGAAMLLEAEVTPRGERVTAYQVQRVASELQSATGGVYASIADNQQNPLLRRVVYQLERDNLLQRIPADATYISIITGMAALAEADRASAVLSFVQAVAALGEGAMQRINQSVLIDILARAGRINEPGLIKSEEMLAAEAKAAEQAVARIKATETGIDVLGQAAQTALNGTAQ